MNFNLRQRSYVAGVVVSAAGITAIGLFLAGVAAAQTASPSARIVSSVENDKVVTLRGNVHPMAQPTNDRGSLPDQQPVTKIHLLLQRSAAQETARCRCRGRRGRRAPVRRRSRADGPR